jgi:hypothetical protein
MSAKAESGKPRTSKVKFMLMALVFLLVFDVVLGGKLHFCRLALVHEQGALERQHLQGKGLILLYAIAVVNLPGAAVLWCLNQVGVPLQTIDQPVVCLLCIVFESWIYAELYVWLKRKKPHDTPNALGQ